MTTIDERQSMNDDAMIVEEAKQLCQRGCEEQVKMNNGNSPDRSRHVDIESSIVGQKSETPRREKDKKEHNKR